MAELLGGQLGRATTQAPTRLSGCEASDGPLTNQVPLHLGHRRHHVEEKPPRRRAGVDAARQARELDTALSNCAVNSTS
jgi:hypothetical protein